MKYTVVRKKPIPEIGTEASSEKSQERILKNNISSESFSSHEEAEKRKKDNDVLDVFLEVPLNLLKPSSDDEGDGTEEKDSWGIRAVGAQDHTYDIDDVTVAVLDTGIDKSHSAFEHLDFNNNNLMDFTENVKGEAGSANDQDGHGTHVAGTIFGKVDNQRIGVAPGIKKVLIGKVIGEEGSSIEMLENAIIWALGEEADVISMSLGMDYPAFARKIENALEVPAEVATSRALKAYRSTLRLLDSLSEYIDAKVKRRKGALVVSASGNASMRRIDPRYTIDVEPPAAADGFLSVGALKPNLQVANFSNTGCDISAPGVSILSAKLGGGLTRLNGTSMATPHVAGVCALWIHKMAKQWQDIEGEMRPQGWANDVLREITSKAKPTGSRNDVGAGMVQVTELK